MASGVMDKSPDAFRTISEVADDLDIPQHVLRFWETRFNHIKPLKRGGGRRYYRPDDIDLLKGIRHLLYGEGYTIKGVQRILKEEGVRFVQAIGRGSRPLRRCIPSATETISRRRHLLQKIHRPKSRKRRIFRSSRSGRNCLGRPSVVFRRLSRISMNASGCSPP